MTPHTDENEVAPCAQQLAAATKELVARHVELCANVATAMDARLKLLQRAVRMLLLLADDGTAQLTQVGSNCGRKPLQMQKQTST